MRAKAIVLAQNGQNARFSLENLSAGGARLVGDLPLAVGESIEVLLELDSVPVALVAEVIRVGSGDVEDVAIEFRNVSVATQDRMQNAVLAALERQRVASPNSVLVIDGKERIRVALERDLAELGRDAVLAATKLEALWNLQDRGLRIDTAIVDVDPDGTTIDILGYLIEAHPDVRRIMLSSGPIEQLQQHVSSGRIHAVLAKPWHPRGLRAALRTEPGPG